MPVSKEIAAQIDAAFDYRGHVTLVLEGGETVEGFLFNRELAPLRGEPYVEVLRKDSEERLRFPAARVRSVAMTGKDFAQPFVPPQKS
jgi:hypothetical protein